jgi:hypothetical protein
LPAYIEVSEPTIQRCIACFVVFVPAERFRFARRLK